MTDSIPSETPVSDLRATYLEALRCHAVQLIWEGHASLSRPGIATAEEDEITGWLVECIKRYAESWDRPAWVDHYDIREQVPQNVVGKSGKGRPKIDIEIERHTPGPRLRICFEAKRLSRTHRISKYFGSEGLGAFLTGYYPTTHNEAGMLGYFQDGTEEHWLAKLRRMFTNDKACKSVFAMAPLDRCEIVEGVVCHHSRHLTATGAGLLVVHIFLPCL